MVSLETNPIGNLRHFPEIGSYGPFFGLSCQDSACPLGYRIQATTARNRFLASGNFRRRSHPPLVNFNPAWPDLRGNTLALRNRASNPCGIPKFWIMVAAPWDKVVRTAGTLINCSWLLSSRQKSEPDSVSFYRKAQSQGSEIIIEQAETESIGKR